MSLIRMGANAMSIFKTGAVNTGNNITNAATEGYTRQRVELVSRLSQRIGSSFVGSGVQIESIERITDEFSLQQMRQSTADTSSSQEILDNAIRLDSMLSSNATNLSSSLEGLFGVLKNVADNPAVNDGRLAVRNEAENLVSNFRVIYDELQRQAQDIDGAILDNVEAINAIAESILELNNRIAGSVTIEPELLDQRDLLLADLSEHIQISAIEQDDRSVFVSIGNGQILVGDKTVNALSTGRNPFEPQKIDIFTSGSLVTEQLVGGMLGGLLELREDIVEPTFNQLGRTAVVLAEKFNEQHRLGMDSDGELGENFFEDMNSTTIALERVTPSEDNIGTQVLSATISDAAELTENDYRLTYNGTDYTLLNLDTEISQTFATLPQTVDGFTIGVSTAGTVSAGDDYLIRPTRFAAGRLEVRSALTAEKVALAQPVRSITSSDNVGEGDLLQPKMMDRTAFDAVYPAHFPISITFTSATTYDISTSGGYTETGISYDPDVDNNLFPTPGAFDPGFTVVLRKEVESGDTFSIEAGLGGVSDSLNAGALSALQGARIVDGSRFTLQESYTETVSFVGTKANQSEIKRDASQVLLDQAQVRIATVSEVSLEEEAANLLKFQHMFEASGQLIDVARSLFRTIISVVGGG